jgi:hypothetical protein
MLCLTCPRTCTCTHTYYLYRLIPHLASNGFISIGAGLEIETLTEIVYAQRRRGSSLVCEVVT